jgi:hypothetical protein
MNIIEALTLAKQGKKVRPISWHGNQYPVGWIVYNPYNTDKSKFVEYRDVPGHPGIVQNQCMHLYDEDYLGEWEVVE